MKEDFTELTDLRLIPAEVRLYLLFGSLAYRVAGFEVFEVVAHYPLAKVHDVEDPLVGDRIIGVAPFAASLHITAPREAP